jgi:hypothetical protein
MARALLGVSVRCQGGAGVKPDGTRVPVARRRFAASGPQQGVIQSVFAATSTSPEP